MVVRAHCDRDPLLKLTDGVAECDAPSSLAPFILILKKWQHLLQDWTRKWSLDAMTYSFSLKIDLLNTKLA